jgi:hypothetical protein
MKIVKYIICIPRGAKLKPGFVQGFRVTEEEVCLKRLHVRQPGGLREKKIIDLQLWVD